MHYETRQRTTNEQLALGRCAANIAQGLHERYFPTIDTNAIREVVLSALLAAPKTGEGADTYEPLKIPALEIMATAAKNDQPIYLWTVGDTGEYVDEAQGIHDPAYNYQQTKFIKSGAAERVAKLAGKESVEIHINTSPATKEPALRDILAECESNDIEVVYVIDDLEANEEIVNQMRSEFPALTIKFYQVKKDEDTQGNIAASRDMVARELDDYHKNGVSAALVMDLDETTFETDKSLRRAAALSHAALTLLSSQMAEGSE